MKVFLGGTCNDSAWRAALIPYLERHGIDYFNPVVEDWTPECVAREVAERAAADVRLTVLTPLMTGVYAVAEVVEDACTVPEKTILCVIERERKPDGRPVIQFGAGQMRSMTALALMVRRHGAVAVASIEDVITEILKKRNLTWRMIRALEEQP